MSGEGVTNPPSPATGIQIRDAIVALDDNNRRIVITDPADGQYKIYTIQRTSDGKLRIKTSAMQE